ncbi:asparaginase-domain-containing protein [Tuber brumale]|nr:asparaginase-domain-containing protein [Tuber brumale]
MTFHLTTPSPHNSTPSSSTTNSTPAYGSPQHGSPTQSSFPTYDGPGEDGHSVAESRVLIIMTGGTICMRMGKDGYVPANGFLDACLKPRPSFNDGSPTKYLPVMTNDETEVMLESLRTPPSKHARRVRYAILEFNPLLDSSSINAKGWGEIAKSIKRNYTLFDAFVILHGTDSLAYTSSALSFMISNLGKSIILTGSQAPMAELHNDATDNLLGSLIIAGHYMVPEVCLFFNHRLFRGNRATKSNAHDFRAFSSPNFGSLGKVGISTNINWNLVNRPSTLAPFSVQTSLSTAHVACLRIFPGILPEMIEGILALKNLKGLVLETFGAGNMPEDERLMTVLRKGVDHGIVIVNVTQCITGSVSPLYASGTALARAGIVFGLDMTTEAALTKLSCLLAKPELTVTDIRRQMSLSLRGELTEQSATSFSHPNSLLPPKLSRLTALAYAIKKGDQKSISSVLRESNEFLLNEFDYSGNTPLHLASTCRNIDILRDFLSQGASVHLRNGDGRTPLFLAADSGIEVNVSLLRESGAHLHAEEVEHAKLKLKTLKWNQENVGSLQMPNKVLYPVTCTLPRC